MGVTQIWVRRFSYFEVGPQYADATPDGQQLVAGAIRSGKTSARDWTKSSRSVDLFDIKADALFVFESLGAPINNLQVDSSGAPSWYHPGRSGAFRLGPKCKVTLAIFTQKFFR